MTTALEMPVSLSIRHSKRIFSRPQLLYRWPLDDASCKLSSSLPHPAFTSVVARRRQFSSTRRVTIEGRNVGDSAEEEEEGGGGRGHSKDDKNADFLAQQKDKQARAPWHREGSNIPPVKRPRSAGAMTKGKLLTTPSRLLKLIIPLTTVDMNTDRKDVQPLALLVHPQQPLSYLERLIQAELPTITTDDGKQRIPAVHFKAEDMAQDEIKPRRARENEEDEEEEEMEDGEEGGRGKDEKQEQGDDEMNIDGKTVHTGKISSVKEVKAAVEPDQAASVLRGGPGEGGVESYSGAGQHAPDPSSSSSSSSSSSPIDRNFVRWSTSTEIGDFIRDAARGKEFAVEIEGSGGGDSKDGGNSEIMVGVPSFGDRTHYLRTRLRKTSRRIADMASVKAACDSAAQRSAQRVALGGFGGLVGWWVGVWYLTFQTSLGWDVMEPVTYLVGLSTLMAGYLWFLYHNREVSYRSALNLTVSRRQHQLYQARGFDLDRWENLVQDANALRREIRRVADEYDVEWDERKDEYDEVVTKALKREREATKKRGRNRSDEDDEDEGGHDDDVKESGKEKK